MNELYLKEEFCLEDEHVEMLKSNISNVFKQIMNNALNASLDAVLSKYEISLDENQRKYVKYLSDGTSDDIIKMLNLQEKFAEIFVKDMEVQRKQFIETEKFKQKYKIY